MSKNKNDYILKNVEDFALGSFENTKMEEGYIMLGASGGRYVQSGCYTSPAVSLSVFTELIPSFNACTPSGTSVELQLRIFNQDGWSRWFSFGKWSPFIARASCVEDYGGIEVAAEKLRINDKTKAADTAQMRIFLYTEDDQKSPTVHLISISVRPLRQLYGKDVFVDRRLPLPKYSCMVREPALAMRIASATSLTMLMNRWGEDVLPEEVARSLYDYGSGRFENLTFLAAGGGAFGYQCFVKYAGINTLRQEIKSGFCVGALVGYSAPDISSQQEAPTAKLMAIQDSPIVNSKGHLVAVFGFEHVDGVEHILFNDPFSRKDAEVSRKISVKEFEDIYMGVCLTLHKTGRHAGRAKPFRTLCNAEINDDKLQLFCEDRRDILASISAKEAASYTFCSALSGAKIYASAAQREFRYFNVHENEKAEFRISAPLGKTLYFYCVGPSGETWVAEKDV